MRVRTFKDVYTSLEHKGFLVSAQITKKGKPLTILKNKALDQSKNILFISRDYRGLDERNEDKTLLPCKAPGIEVVGNIMTYLNIGQASILGIYDILDWQEGYATEKLNPLNLNETVRVEPLNPAEKKQLVDSFFKSLPTFIEKFGFTGIVFCGGYKQLDDDGNFKTDWTLWGRVWKESGIPATLTVPLNYVAVDRDDEEATNRASLCGFIVDHVRNVLHGDNYYTLDFKGTKTYIVDTVEKFDKFMDRLRHTKVSSWDTETTGLSRLCEDILTIQVALDEKTSYIIPYKHPESTFTSSDCEHIAQAFKKYFEFEARGSIHVYQNAKYDLNQFYHLCGWKYYSALIWDIMAGEFALEENRKNLQPFGIGPFSLKFFTYNYGGGHIYDEGEVGKEDRNDLSKKDLKGVAEYGAKDVIIPYQIYNFQRDKAKRLGDENFENVVLHVIGDILYCVTILEQNGEKIDKDYLLSLMGESSDFGKSLKQLQDSIYQTKEVQIANDIICEKAGFKATSGGGLFGIKKWLFDIGKPEHKKILFVDVMHLEADKTDKGKDSIGKAFKAKYKKNPIVASFDKLEKMKKAYSAFIKAHFDRYKTDKDLRFDSRIRSDYMFQKVLTGRISASNPNLQQIPSRGEFCKIVKRQFVVNPDHFFLKADYSAHEVRNWGNVAGDPNVCQSFDAGKQIRKELRYYFENEDELLKRFTDFQKETRWTVDKGSDVKQLTYEEKKNLIETIKDKRFKKLCELMFDLENRGDVHKLNYEFFRGVPAAQVTPEQRQSVKGLVFGTIYGRGAKSIAEEINSTEQEAQDLMDLMAEKFAKGWEWLLRCKRDGLKTYEVVSPIGRIRHLFSYMNGSNNLISATDRQGPNSCIQGFSSDVGFASGKIMQDLCWQWFWSRGIDFDFRYCNVVHDSTETEVSLAHLPIALYMIEHSYSTLAHRKLKKLYGLDLVCGYETEADLGVCMAHMETFKSWINFKSIVNESIDWGVKNLPCWSYSEESLKKCFHNYDILDKIRKQELKQTKGEKVDTYMYLNRDNILKVGLEL